MDAAADRIAIGRLPAGGWLLVVVALVGLAVGGCGGGADTGIAPVYHWVVGFATGVGEWVTAQATTFAEAVQRAWVAFWGTDLVSGVRPDDADPLRGQYDGTLRCEIAWGESGARRRENRMVIELDRPWMVRTSPDSTAWELAPEEREKLDELRDRLTQVR